MGLGGVLLIAFQLPLSGSRAACRAESVQLLCTAYFQLPLSGSLVEESKVRDEMYHEITFQLPLSGSLSRIATLDYLRGRQDFQLPLSGSRYR